MLAIPVTQAAAAEIAGVTVGAGLRTSYTVVDPAGGDSTGQFKVDNVRLYVSGKATDSISFMFNSDYSNTTSDITVIDAAAQFSTGDTFNLWAGRFLAPSERSNLYGAYYASNWGYFTYDGVQASYPQHVVGRDEGVMYWGQFGITKVALGVFNNDPGSGVAAGGDTKYAGRLQFDFWDPEGGYYQNATYYGGKDLFALGLATQGSGGESAYSADVLLEKKLGGGGVVTLEAEYKNYDGFGDGWYLTRNGDGYYGLAGFLFPQTVGIGKFQVLGKFGTLTNDDTDVETDTLEINLNYIIKDFNARVQAFYIDVDGHPKVYGVGLQLQM